LRATWCVRSCTEESIAAPAALLKAAHWLTLSPLPLAAQLAGGPQMAMRYGRKDAPSCEDCTPDGRLPGVWVCMVCVCGGGRGRVKPGNPAVAAPAFAAPAAFLLLLLLVLASLLCATPSDTPPAPAPAPPALNNLPSPLPTHPLHPPTPYYSCRPPLPGWQHGTRGPPATRVLPHGAG